MLDALSRQARILGPQGPVPAEISGFQAGVTTVFSASFYFIIITTATTSVSQMIELSVGKVSLHDK